MDEPKEQRPTATIKLPCGKQAELWVRHNDKELLVDMSDQIGCPTYRGTDVRLRLDGLDYAARSVCKPPDNFSKAAGRRRAANRLLTLLRDRQRFPTLALSKDDRAAIFCAALICHAWAACGSAAPSSDAT